TREPSLRYIPMVDDADDRRVGRRLGRQEGKRRFPAAAEEAVPADAGADRIERDERPAAGLAVLRDRLQHEERGADEIGILDARDDFADDARERHEAAGPGAG